MSRRPVPVASLPRPGALAGPRAEVEGAGVLVPAVVLRLAVLAAGGALVVLLAAGRGVGWLAPLMAALVLVCACAPGTVVVGVLGLLAIVVQLAYGGLGPRAVLTALALHLTWSLAAVAAAVPAAGRFELAVLWPLLRRAGAVTALTAVVALAVAGARGAGVRAGEQLLLLVGVVVLAGALAVALVLRDRRRQG